jgi:hypothetical protein
VNDVALEVDPVTGRYAYSLVTVSVPRQSGKTVDVFDVMATRAIGQGALCAYTADTGQKARRRWRGFVDDTLPKAFRPKGTVRLSNGDESWRAGAGKVRPFAPNRDAIHGDQTDLAVIDEAWSFLEEEGDALTTAIKPTQQTRRRPQVWILSAAGDYRSSWWKRLVEAGRAGAPGHAHFEWGAPDDAAVFDAASWPSWHPGVGHLFDAATIPDLLTGISRDDAIRSYGNRWRLAVVSKWPPGAFEAATIPAPVPMPPALALAVDVEHDRSASSLSAVHRLPDGRILTQLLANGAGTSWLIGETRVWLERTGRLPVLYDEKGQAAAVVDADPAPNAGGRIRWEPIDSTRYERSCSGHFEAVVEGRAVHLEAPELADAAAIAVDRKWRNGDAWAWSRASSPGDVTPLISCALAYGYAARRQASKPIVEGGRA